MSELMLQAESISFHYGSEPVLENVCLTASAGECVGIAGINGSGKSTLLSILAGMRRASGGSLICMGHDLFREKGQFAKLIGYVPQDNPLLSDLSVSDNLKLWSGSRPDPSLQVLQKLELVPLLKKRAGKLSGGQKRRLTIACALLGDQRILIMDEPTSALDVGQKEIIHRYIKDFTAQKGVVIMATHDIIEMELCDRLYHLSEHRLTEADVNQVVYLLRKEND